ncbi:MAG TPA: ABC transporter transmembrane domain-containing protein, partial [Candidatus Limnocylindrales bacterium]
MALGIATAVLAVAQAWLLSTAISSAFQDGAGLAALRTTLIALAVVLAARAAIGWAQEAAARSCSAAVKSSLRMHLLRHVATNLPALDSGRASGEIVALTTRGLDSLDTYFGRYLPQVVLAMIVPLVVLACLAVSDTVATITVALTLPIIPFFMALIGSYTVRRRKRRWEALARLSG